MKFVAWKCWVAVAILFIMAYFAPEKGANRLITVGLLIAWLPVLEIRK